MKFTALRKHLPKKYKKAPDEEVELLINQLELLAEIFIETFEKTGSKKQLGVIDSSEEEKENEDRN